MKNNSDQKTTAETSNDQIIVTAVNPDNSVEIDSLTNFFSSTFGQSYPIKSVYEDKYWQAHLGSRFYSIVAKDSSNRTLLHLGVSIDPAYPRQARIVYPAIANDIELTPILIESVQRLLSLIGQRQEWTLLYYFLIDEHVEMNNKLMELLGGEVTGVCANYFPNTSDSDGSVIAVINVLAKCEDTVAQVYLPKHLHSAAKKVFSLFPFKRSLNTKPSLPQQGHISAESPAINIMNFSRTDVAHVFVEPSLLTNYRELLKLLSDIRSSKHVIFINLQDPKAPSLIQELEGVDYTLTGFLPLIHNRDYGILCKVSPETQFVAPNLNRASYLYEYITQQK